MNTISLCMIVKNEERFLARCLSSTIGLVDEIIIVDTGSTDKTIEVAKKFTNKVYNFKWNNNFSDARNFAFSFATSNYIMWLDADDVVPKHTLKKLINLKASLSADVYMLKYDIAFDTNGKATFSYFRERILKNCSHAHWQGVVHECITPFGKVERLPYSIIHKKETHTISTRNLTIYKNLLKTRPLTPREQYYYGRELFDHKKYKKCIKVLNEFVASNLGWAENVIDALFVMSKCYKALNQENDHFECLLKTLKYDTPRANICCAIADHFILKKQYTLAIYWYKTAIGCNDVSSKGGFVEPIYYNYYPYLQLCCCHYALGDVQKANQYNERAGKYNNSQIVINNRNFFNNILKN